MPNPLFHVVKPKEANIEVGSHKEPNPIRVVLGPHEFKPYVIQFTEWQGKTRISVRQHFSPKGKPNLLLPSKTGLDWTEDLAYAIAEALLAIYQERHYPNLQDDPVIAEAQDLGAEVVKVEPEPPAEPEEEIPF